MPADWLVSLSGMTGLLAYCEHLDLQTMDTEDAEVQCCFTSAETIRLIRDGEEPRTVTSTFTQLLSSDTEDKKIVVVLLPIWSINRYCGSLRLQLLRTETRQGMRFEAACPGKDIGVDGLLFSN